SCMTTLTSPRSVEALRTFVATSLDDALAGADDTARAEQSVLALFASVAREVPAYAAFLADHGVDPTTIRTIQDFQHLPLVDKHNYVYEYPLAELCRGGGLGDCDMFAVSSGSTGQPTVWPRSVADEYPIARRFEQAFYD